MRNIETYPGKINVITNSSHREGLDSVTEDQRSLQLEDRDVIDDDAGVIVFMHPHVNNLDLLMVALQRVLDVVCSSHYLDLNQTVS